MATAKKQTKGAQPSAAVPVKKLTRKEKHVINSARFRKIQAEEREKILAKKPKVPDKCTHPGRATNPALKVKRAPGQVGRPPVEYTPELADRLYELIVSGLSLEKISRLPEMPSLGTLLRWIATRTHKFSEDYLRAKQMLVPVYEEQARDAALEALEGTTVVERTGTDFKGNPIDYREVRKGDNVERAKLIVDVNKWTLGWLMPKKHGRQADVTSGQPNEQLTALFNSLKSGPAEPQDD
jgi:hypothetical protein